MTGTRSGAVPLILNEYSYEKAYCFHVCVA